MQSISPTIMQHTVRTPDAARLVYVERRGGAPGSLGNAPMEAQTALHQQLDAQGLRDRITYGISIVDGSMAPNAPEPPLYQACYVVADDAPLALTGELRTMRFDPGKSAVFTYVGSYEGLGAAWGAVMGEHLPASGLTPRSGPMYEIYLDDMATTPEDQLRTELCVPVE